MMQDQKKLYQKLPNSPGVYLMKSGKGQILYIGKAGSLKRRVSSYFQKSHDSRIQKMVSEIRKVDHKKTDTALEALILESILIKKHQPPYNVREKDDKSFLYVEITRETFPRILLIRGKEKGSKNPKRRFGPFTASSNIREALRIMRRIFPYSIHPADKKFSRACFEYQIGLCPGTCIGEISKSGYAKIIRNLILFFEGKKKRIISSLKKDMTAASKKLEFETAQRIKRQIFALEHIRDTAFITENKIHEKNIDKRIEGYDVSNISGTSAVGSMVVFVGDEPSKDQYRKFKIHSISQPDDVGMLREMIRRRLGNAWPLPDLILIDGGKPQVNVTRKVLNEAGLKIPIVGIAKGPTRKKNEFIGRIPAGVKRETLIRVRDEAHRFAITYHKKVRGRTFLS